MRRLPRSRSAYLWVAAVYAVVVYILIEIVFTGELVQAGALSGTGALTLILATAPLHVVSFVLFGSFSLVAALLAYRLAERVTAALSVEERRTAELATVSELANRLSGRHDTSGIGRESIAAVRDALDPASTVSFVEFDDTARSFRVADEVGPAAGAIRGNAYPIGVLPEAVRERVVTERRMLVFGDTRGEATWNALAARFSAIASARTFVLVPLASESRLLGAIMIRDERPEALPGSQLALVLLLAHTIAGALENARSIAEAEARADREAIVNRVAQHARGSLNANEVLRRTVEELGEALHASRAFVALGTDEDDLRVAQEWTAQDVAPLGTGSQKVPVARDAAREGRTMVLHDVDSDERVSADPTTLGDLRSNDTRALIATPMTIAGQLVGALVIGQTGAARTWTGEEVRLVESVTHELRVAMEAVRLFQARQRETERMLALHRASAILAGQTDPRVILEEILKNAVRLLGQGSASLYLWVPEAGILRNVRDYLVREDDAARSLRPNEGISGTAFSTLAPVIVNDYQGWPGATEAAKRAGQRSAIAVPLMRTGKPIGSIVVRSYDPSVRFTEEDGRLLTLFADQAASALAAAEAFEQQRAAVEELERLSKAKSDFVSIVSHEFRTPLTGIQGFSEMLRDEDLRPEEVRDFANDINKDAQRLNRMITDMLDLDRMESGRMELHREEIDLNAIVRVVVDRVRPGAPRHPITLDLDERVPTLSGDRDKITQVMANLLSNAVKYSPDGGDIAVRSRANGGFAEVAVVDHGLGIPTEALESVFERYSRIETPATRHIPGTGLGLPIVRQIVELHGGRAWAESAVGDGSTFTFTLPLVSA